MNLKELSQLLGLSQTTVSRALNGYPEVSEVTRKRVQDAALAHNYTPNPRARGLATGHSRCIGHVLSVNDQGELVNPIFADFMAGAGETYSKFGYDIMVIRVDAGGEADAYRALKRRGAVDGVVLHAPRHDDARLPVLSEIGLPFVVHGRSSAARTPYDWLDVNNRSAFSQLTQHLIDLGHRRIALVNGDERQEFAVQRRTGYEASLQKAGLPVDPDLMSTGEMTEGHGCSNARRMLAQADRPTAFVTASIISAFGVRRALDEMGLRVGTDVSIATFDDCLSYIGNGGETPFFTCVRSSVRQAGTQVGQLLVNRIKAPDAPPASVLLEVEFVQGVSTARCKSLQGFA